MILKAERLPGIRAGYLSAIRASSRITSSRPNRTRRLSVGILTSSIVILGSIRSSIAMSKKLFGWPGYLSCPILFTRCIPGTIEGRGCAGRFAQEGARVGWITHRCPCDDAGRLAEAFELRLRCERIDGAGYLAQEGARVGWVINRRCCNDPWRLMEAFKLGFRCERIDGA